MVVAAGGKAGSASVRETTTIFGRAAIDVQGDCMNDDGIENERQKSESSFRRTPESRFSAHELGPGFRRDDGLLIKEMLSII